MATGDPVQDSRFSGRLDAARGEPVGQHPIPAGSRLRPVECIYCSKPLGVSTWDYLNGFLDLIFALVCWALGYLAARNETVDAFMIAASQRLRRTDESTE